VEGVTADNLQAVRQAISALAPAVRAELTGARLEDIVTEITIEHDFNQDDNMEITVNKTSLFYGNKRVIEHKIEIDYATKPCYTSSVFWSILSNR